jgi:hypothetical protein
MSHHCPSLPPSPASPSILPYTISGNVQPWKVYVLGPEKKDELVGSILFILFILLTCPLTAIVFITNPHIVL